MIALLLLLYIVCQKVPYFLNLIIYHRSILIAILFVNGMKILASLSEDGNQGFKCCKFQFIGMLHTSS